MFCTQWRLKYNPGYSESFTYESMPMATEYHLHKKDSRVLLQNIKVLYCHHDECINRQNRETSRWSTNKEHTIEIMWPLHNNLADFLLPTHKEIVLQLQVSNYPGSHDICEQNCRFWILLPSHVCYIKRMCQSNHLCMHILKINRRLSANRKSFPYIMNIVDELQKFSPLNVLLYTVCNWIFHLPHTIITI